MDFNNKVIWITGASSGIGRELAIQLSQYNCKLILSSRRNETLQKVKTDCNHPGNVSVLDFDLALYGNMKNVVADALKLFGTIDILVNNGGISQRSLIKDTDIMVDKKLMEVDYLGTVSLTKALLPHFIMHKKGHFVTVTSIMGKFGSPYRSGYCGAKHALHGFFDVLRQEHEKDGIAVTIVCPGFVNTDVSKNAITGDGTSLNTQDTATENGLDVAVFCAKMISAIKRKKHEVYIGKKEIFGVYVKRFFPKLLHKIVLKSNVR
ncbi:SDR family oxidoreductase [Lacinutrix undariae]